MGRRITFESLVKGRLFEEEPCVECLEDMIKKLEGKFKK